jgi:hypothetical protein
MGSEKIALALILFLLENNLETRLLFVDFEKKLGSVLRNKLWEIIICRGIPSHLMRVVQSLYQDTGI